jgi:gluconate 2-dehydrogenase gamma chain
MDRRENIKLLLTGTIGAGLLFTTGCEQKPINPSPLLSGNGYGRTPDETAHDLKMLKETFFTERERKMVETLCEIIIPADDKSGGANDAGVPEFIEFMMKDYEPFRLQMRGGLMWLKNECHRRFGKEFLMCVESEQMQVIDDIAWPDKASPEMSQGVKFFNLMRNLTATGFFTSKMGIDDLGYAGNRPNEWDGVPEAVLKKHGLEYDQRTLDICLKMEDRNNIAVWDEQGNLTG